MEPTQATAAIGQIKYPQSKGRILSKYEIAFWSLYGTFLIVISLLLSPAIFIFLCYYLFILFKNFRNLRIFPVGHYAYQQCERCWNIQQEQTKLQISSMSLALTIVCTLQHLDKSPNYITFLNSSNKVEYLQTVMMTTKVHRIAGKSTINFPKYENIMK